MPTQPNQSRHDTADSDPDPFTIRGVGVGHVVNDTATIEAVPPMSASTPTTTAPQAGATSPGISQNHIDQSPNRNHVSCRVFAVTAQLRTAAAHLQSENRKMRDEIYQVINEVVDASPLNETPGPDWCTVFRSEAELQYLQSNYEQLYNQHMSDSNEIAKDLYDKMVKSYSLLRTSYLELVKVHAVLEDDLERLARQLAGPAEPGSVPFVIHLQDNTMPVVGFGTVLKALRNRQAAQVQQPSSQPLAFHGEPPIIQPAKRSLSNTNQDRYPISNSSVVHSNLNDEAPTPRPLKRRKVDSA